MNFNALRAKFGKQLVWIGVSLSLMLLLNHQDLALRAEPLAPLTVDDNAGSVSYSGSWGFSGSSTNAMWSTLHWSDVYGSEATFSFNGSRITRFFSMAPNRSSEEIYIDNIYQGTYSTYAGEIRRQVGRTWSVSPGNHTIKVRALGGGFTDLDAFAVDIATVSAGTYDNTHAQIRYFGTWADSTYTPGTYSNSLKTSNVAQSGFHFTFTGDEVTYIYSMHSNRGKAAITIDGVDKGYIDQYSPDLRRQIGKTFSGLGIGTHVLNVVVTNQKNPASSDYHVDLDALVVGNVYDRTAAVNYANTWAKARNSNYPNYGNQGDNPCNDCTNYVSQVLQAGGLPQIAHTSYNNKFYWYTYYIFGWDASNTWKVTSAPDIASIQEHVLSFGARYQYAGSDPSVLNGGDFFLMDLDTAIYSADHARVIVGWGIVQEGDQIGQWRLLASQHCTDRKRVRWDYNLPSSIARWAYRVIY